jgi:NADH-quinone oxidoreductase subunit L
VVTVPLILLAIPSVYAGFAYIGPMLFGGYFGDSIAIAESHEAVAKLKEEWHGAIAFIEHGLFSLPFLLAVAGIAGGSGPDKKVSGRAVHAARQ